MGRQRLFKDRRCDLGLWQGQKGPEGVVAGAVGSGGGLICAGHMPLIPAVAE